MNTLKEMRFHMPILSVIINYVIASLILILSLYLIYTEINKKAKSDLFVDLTLSLMVIGVSIYNLVDIKFDFKTPIFYIFIFTIITIVVNIGFFSTRHILKKRIK